MLDDKEKKKSEDVVPKKLEEVKNAASVMYGAGAITGGIATGNPFLVASGIVTLFGGYLAPFMVKRRDKYFDALKSDLDKLIVKVDGLSIDNILSDEKVLSAILQVYPVVIRTLEEEKQELLRNVVLNTALKINTEDDLRTLYIQLVDEFTPTHIRILKFLENPQGFVEKYNLDPEAVSSQSRHLSIPRLIPEIKDTYPMFLKGLEDKQLIMSHEQLIFPTKDNPNPNLTVYGLNFLRFISPPFNR